MDLPEVVKDLEGFEPLHKYLFGHSPFQIQFFKNSSQRGSDKFEYWNQVLQLKSLYQSIKELQLEREELVGELGDCGRFFPPWSRRSRRRKIPRLRWQLDKIDGSIKSKAREAEYHLKFIRSEYPELIGMDEEKIFEVEREYWVQRLSKQMALTHIAARAALPAGDLSAVYCLPENIQKEVLEKTKEYLKSPDLVKLCNPQDSKLLRENND